MKISLQSLDALIKKYESFSPIPYLCPAGKLTIGYGHVILPGESFTTITYEEGQALLLKDVAIFENCINQYVRVPISQNQFDALVSFVFNIGCNAFINSTLLEKLNVPSYQSAAAEFMRWNKSNGKVLNGLTNRRQAEMNLFLKGCTP